MAFSVVLISAAFGVNDEITRRLSVPDVQKSGLVDVSLIEEILTILTVVVTLGMVAQTATATFVLGVSTMRSRREEIALRRQSGVLRSTLLWEFLRVVITACLVGGFAGELAGVGVAELLKAARPVFPLRFTAVSLLAAFPVTVSIAVCATLVPAWQAASASPALLRKGG